MSLTLTLKITPGKTNWVATAMLREDAEDSSKEIYCQKELAWRMKLTGAQVNDVMSDLGMETCGSTNTWVAGYDLTIVKANRAIALSLLKQQVLLLVQTLHDNFELDLIVYTTVGRDTPKYIGSVSSSSFLADLGKWQG